MRENLSFDELSENVLKQLSDQKYMDSTLTIYRRTFNRIHVFMERHGTNAYTREIGEQFLDNCKVSDSTMTAYKCAVRRLNDYLEEIPYKCHRTDAEIQVPDVFSQSFERYLSKCENDGNKQWTISAKKKSCARFLRQLYTDDIRDLALLSADQISRAINIFDNKDDLDRIRQFLRYLADMKVTKWDFSGIVPRLKRVRGIPSVYSPEEISRMEDSIDI